MVTCRVLSPHGGRDAGRRMYVDELGKSGNKESGICDCVERLVRVTSSLCMIYLWTWWVVEREQDWNLSSVIPSSILRVILRFTFVLCSSTLRRSFALSAIYASSILHRFFALFIVYFSPILRFTFVYLSFILRLTFVFPSASTLR